MHIWWHTNGFHRITVLTLEEMKIIMNAIVKCMQHAEPTSSIHFILDAIGYVNRKDFDEKFKKTMNDR